MLAKAAASMGMVMLTSLALSRKERRGWSGDDDGEDEMR